MTAQPWNIGDPTGPGDQFNGRDHHHHLVAFIQPAREDVSTKFGDDTATRCRYVICIESNKEHEDGLIHYDPLVFGNLGSAAYAGGAHAIVLGRIGQSDAKPGQSPAWILHAADDDDKALAKTWLEGNAQQDATGRITIG